QEEIPRFLVAMAPALLNSILLHHSYIPLKLWAARVNNLGVRQIHLTRELCVLCTRIHRRMAMFGLDRKSEVLSEAIISYVAKQVAVKSA
ncbi:hypothetical protein BV898_19875, partial [Hypsibius exemplaris]